MTKRRQDEILTFAIMGAIVVALAIGSGPALAGAAAGFFAVAIAACWAFVHFSKRDGDIRSIVAGSADERQQVLDRGAEFVAGRVALVLCLGAAVVQMARGENPSPFAQIAGASGIAYVVALAIIRYRV